MRTARVWLVGTLLLASLAGMATFITSSQGVASAAQREERAYWRHHDGRWSHWDPRDRRWYYTDGRHWYWHNGKAWELYRFDRTFGRENFERGGYVVPAPGAQVVVPTHGVYVAPR
jgi:hypothetical protein